MFILHTAGQNDEKKDAIIASVVAVLTTTFTELIIPCHILLKALYTVFTHLNLATTLKVGPNMPIL